MFMNIYTILCAKRNKLLVFRKSLYYKDLGFQKKVEIHGNRVFGGDLKVKLLMRLDTPLTK
jgi:hypothetical protein